MKGQTNNPNGRPKGTPNKITATIRNWIVELINNNRDLIENDFLQLEPKDRLMMLEKLLPYIMPKVLNADEVEGACYTKDDVIEEDGWSMGIATARKVERWFEK